MKVCVRLIIGSRPGMMCLSLVLPLFFLPSPPLLQIIALREPHEYIFVFANTNICVRGQINACICTSIRAQTSMNTRYSRVSVEYLSFNYLWGGLRYTKLLCKGVIYTIAGPNIQLHMREYTRKMINLMYGAQRRVHIIHI